MSQVARLIAKIEDEMQPDTPDGDMEAPALNPEHLRMIEALLFAADEPLDMKALGSQLPDDADVPALVRELQATYESAASIWSASRTSGNSAPRPISPSCSARSSRSSGGSRARRSKRSPSSPITSR
jgi:hypothetical protein